MPAAEDPLAGPPLLPWMRLVLRLASIYNLSAGLLMVVFYHEVSKVLGMPRPVPIMPFQLDGLLVGLFGVGYWLVASRPLENRNVLWLGFWSKLLGTILCGYHVARGDLPLSFVPLVAVSDAIYLPPFFVIARRLDRFAIKAGEEENS
ncbi:MAG TPA: hypothetical protein VHY91_21305 [Pirellulales bacterium]|jgi:hypothetical protein|nr:hypothetical protein [Pirellulales bacterium]